MITTSLKFFPGVNGIFRQIKRLSHISLSSECNRCLGGVLISGEDRAGRSAEGFPRSIASTDAA
jgi:hypothetical protein